MTRRFSIVLFSLIVIFSLSASAFAEGSATVGAVAEPDALASDPGAPIADHVYSGDYDAVCNDCGAIRRFVEKFDFVDSCIVLIDNDTTHNNPRAVIYTLGDTVYTGDPTNEDLLLQFDPNPVTKWGFSEINKISLTDPGNYIVLYKYNVDKAIIREPLLITVLGSDPDLDPGVLSDINDNLGVIQSLLWVVVVFLICSVFWKFFRWFF